MSDDDTTLFVQDARTTFAPLKPMVVPRGFASPLAAIRDIYTDRSFFVADGGAHSDGHCQEVGISQGCPLSPFLFGMVMTVLMTDARASLTEEARQAVERQELEDVLFADDTLIIGRCSVHVEE